MQKPRIGGASEVREDAQQGPLTTQSQNHLLTPTWLWIKKAWEVLHWGTIKRIQPTFKEVFIWTVFVTQTSSMCFQLCSVIPLGHNFFSKLLSTLSHVPKILNGRFQSKWSICTILTNVMKPCSIWLCHTKDINLPIAQYHQLYALPTHYLFSNDLDCVNKPIILV